MKYRVGRKQKRVILDENGNEVAICHKGKEEVAQQICDLLNEHGLVSKNESLHDVSSSLLNKRIDKWIEENDKNAGMCDGISSVIFTSYSQAYWNVKQFIEVNES